MPFSTDDSARQCTCLARKTKSLLRGGEYCHGLPGQEHPPHNASVHNFRDSPQQAVSSLLWLFLVFWASLKIEDERNLIFGPLMLFQLERGRRGDPRRCGPLFQSLHHPTGPEGQGGASVDLEKTHRLQDGPRSDHNGVTSKAHSPADSSTGVCVVYQAMLVSA